MSLLADEISILFEELQFITSDENGVPVVFTWNSQEYPATRSKIIKRSLFGAGGFTPDNDLSLTVNIVDLGIAMPKPMEMIMFQGEQWRIDSVETSADGAVVTLRCNDPNRAAGVVEREM